MEAPVLVTIQIDTTPGAIGPWLHDLAAATSPHLPANQLLVVGPHTWRGPAVTPYETLALYLAPHRSMPDGADRADGTSTQQGHVQSTPVDYRQVPDQVAIAVTYVPLRHTSIYLEMRVWLPFPATLDFILHHLTDYFTQTGVVLSGVASSRAHLGAPLLPCNQWLTEQIRHITTPGGHSTLYEAWVEQYRAVRGSYPADPRRSFRAAVAAVRRRHRRGTKNDS